MDQTIFSNLTAGLLLGLSAGIAPGPMLTLVIAQTLRFGVKEGCKVAIVPLLSDAPVLCVAWLVSAQLARFQLALSAFSFAGGVLLLWLGYESWQTQTLKLAADANDSAIKPHSMQRGIILNLLNPHPWFFWLTVGVPLLTKASQVSLWAGAAFVAGFYTLLVGVKLIIVLLLGRARVWLTGPKYVWTMRFLALVLWGFALLLWREAWHWWAIAKLMPG